jgi:Derlin-2/3
MPMLVQLVAPWLNVMFFGGSLTFMMVYLWSKRNPGMQVSLLGLVAFSAPYLPWVFLGLSALMGQDVASDLLGIGAGAAHTHITDSRTYVGRSRF